MWFKKLTGFTEESPEQVRANITVHGSSLTSLVNDKTFQCGILETPSLEELRQQIPSFDQFKSRIKVSEVVANVQTLHADSNNQNALFQAASQFNLLEMVDPHNTPEQGIGIYEHDFTQGPACAIACGAGTIFRNYFAEMNGQIGQSETNQIDCLKDVGDVLQNEERRLWTMQNGYALATEEGLQTISSHLKSLSESEWEALKGKLRIGLQLDTEATLSESRHLVSQAYCSALPVAYSHIKPEYWEDFARLILEATYDATLYAALVNLERHDNNKVFLTMVGGGAFGNKPQWIVDAITKAVRMFSNTPLDVKMVSYGKSDPVVHNLIYSLN